MRSAKKAKLLFPAVMLISSMFLGAEEKNFRESPEKYWDFAKLKDAPAFRDASFADSQAKGLRAVLVTGYGPAPDDKTFFGPDPKPLSAKVKAEFFAYIGFPKGSLPAGAHQFFLSAYEKKSRFNDLCGSTSPVILPFPGSDK